VRCSTREERLELAERHELRPLRNCMKRNCWMVIRPSEKFWTAVHSGFGLVLKEVLYYLQPEWANLRDVIPIFQESHKCRVLRHNFLLTLF